MSDEWLESFENFYKDMGPKPSEKHSIERNDVNGPYSKENCRWATSKEQARNKTSNRFVKWNNEVKCLAEWSEILFPEKRNSIISNRIRKGWSIEKAFSTPAFR